MRLCILSFRCFEDAFEYTQWRKVKNATNVTMHPLRQETFENTRWRQIRLKWDMESAESFDNSNSLYSNGSVDIILLSLYFYKYDYSCNKQDTIFLFLIREWQWETMGNCVAVLSFCNLDKNIWQLRQKQWLSCKIWYLTPFWSWLRF